MQAYSDILSSTDSDFEKLRALGEDIDTVVLAADATRNIMILHSPKNFGGTRTRTESKVVGMIGLEAQATWVQINLVSALANCNIVVPTVHKLSACTIAQEVAVIPVPEENGVVRFGGSAIFILAPALRNAILALNTQNPVELIPLMSATARAFDAAHANDVNMVCTAITHSDDLNAWLYGVKQGLINETKYSVIPEDNEVAQYYTSRHLHCIYHGAQRLAFGEGMAVNDNTILRQLNAAIWYESKGNIKF
jgi:hypothetical protein